jgi:hypothetical protein
MGQYVEFMAMGMGLQKDAAGNYNWPGNQGAPPDAPAPAPTPVAAAPARAAAAAPPAQAVAPVKATTPQADIPEPPVVGQASPDDMAAAKKKTLLGG